MQKMGNVDPLTLTVQDQAIIVSDPMSACAEDIAGTYGNYAYCLGKLGGMKNAKKYLSVAKEKGYSKDSIDTICRDLHLFRFLI